MWCRVLAGLFFSLAGLPAVAAQAAGLPEVRGGPNNAVPACATPGRLTLYLQSRNKSPEPKFLDAAAAYQRHGTALGLRWDYAYFQMLLETNYLTFRRGSGRSDVSPAQNNFAGLGAVGGGAGESFPDVSTGALAHLQHLMLYAGEQVLDPVAERTRKVQQWGVLASWHKARRGPMGYGELVQHWAPSDASYADTLEGIAKKFYAEFCNLPDPGARAPQVQASARPPAVAGGAGVAATKGDPAGSGGRFEVLKNAESPVARSALGAGALIDKPPALAPVPPAAVANEPAAARPDLPAKPSNTAALVPPSSGAPGAASAGGKCNVWTASYGGGKALIIKSVSGDNINYTVLEVTAANAAQELQSYIKLYAQGGSRIAEFPDQAKALDKAFELCPEG